jgi:hypothetical protein
LKSSSLPLYIILLSKKIKRLIKLRKKKTEKTELNPNREKKPSQTGKKPSQAKKNRAKPKKTDPSRFEPVFVLKNRTETGRFEPVSVRFWFFLKKIRFNYYFFIKIKLNRK